MSNEIARITEDELSLIEENLLNKNQLTHLLKKTPAKYVKQRPAKGGGTWDYVSGTYVKKTLNLMFGFNWSFNILAREIISGEAIVHGRLTINLPNGQTIVKEQFGNKDVMCKRGSDTPLSIGNDLKSAATDALKKCASEIGIASDIYGKDEFREVKVITAEDRLTELLDLFELKKDSLSAEDEAAIQEIIDEKRAISYSKVIKNLKAI